MAESGEDLTKFTPASLKSLSVIAWTTETTSTTTHKAKIEFAISKRIDNEIEIENENKRTVSLNVVKKTQTLSA